MRRTLLVLVLSLAVVANAAAQQAPCAARNGQDGGMTNPHDLRS